MKKIFQIVCVKFRKTGIKKRTHNSVFSEHVLNQEQLVRMMKGENDGKSNEKTIGTSFKTHFA